MAKPCMLEVYLLNQWKNLLFPLRLLILILYAHQKKDEGKREVHRQAFAPLLFFYFGIAKCLRILFCAMRHIGFAHA